MLFLSVLQTAHVINVAQLRGAVKDGYLKTGQTHVTSSSRLETLEAGFFQLSGEMMCLCLQLKLDSYCPFHVFCFFPFLCHLCVKR